MCSHRVTIVGDVAKTPQQKTIKFYLLSYLRGHVPRFFYL
ncbi:hypothetical protein HMPREF0454_01392 [Hafnia alvei ATCC 51873]|uniref:Uncharacterized protein n=1 Tax=Hafnia alvei ATCC 51873 TaxID=1002364 RepID=G9Y4C8_HAFAL|nr:hypothetical protein HMPREF0454_01392 [Hafnia alvei ATCC 51873]